jgi:hypothetical protein
MKPLTIVLDIEKIAGAWQTSVSLATEAGRDGRGSFFWISAHLAQRWKFKQDDNLLVMPDGGLVALRMMTGVVNFSRSADHGMGRKLHVKDWREFLTELEWFIVSDIRSFPILRLWFLDPNLILGWWANGELSTHNTVARKRDGTLVKEQVTLTPKKFHELVKDIPTPAWLSEKKQIPSVESR